LVKCRFSSVRNDSGSGCTIVTLEAVPSSKIGYLACRTEADRNVALASLAGEVYFWYWLTRGDGFHVTSWIIKDYLRCLDSIPERHFSLLAGLGQVLHNRRFEALVFKKNAGRFVGNFNYRGQFRLTRRADLLILAGLGLGREEALGVFDWVQRVLAINERAGEKAIPDHVRRRFPPKPVDEANQGHLFGEIDRVLAQHYGFSEEELDFIINYDIKYRMGREGEKEEG
jgi:hypothetical protein